MIQTINISPLDNSFIKRKFTTITTSIRITFFSSNPSVKTNITYLFSFPLIITFIANLFSLRNSPLFRSFVSFVKSSFSPSYGEFFVSNKRITLSGTIISWLEMRLGTIENLFTFKTFYIWHSFIINQSLEKSN